METTLVLQDPAFTALAGRAAAPAGSADASLLFASTLQQELATPGAAPGIMADAALTPRVQRAELTEWLRSLQDGRAAVTAPNTDANSPVTLPSQVDSAEAQALTLRPGSSATFNPLPDAPVADDQAPVLPDLAGDVGVIISAPVARPAVQAAVVAVAPALQEAATPGPQRAPADAGSEAGLAQASITPDTPREQKRQPPSLDARRSQQQEPLPAQTPAVALAEPASSPLLPTSPVLPQALHEAPAPDPTPPAPQADADTTAAVMNAAQPTLPHTAATPPQVQSTAVSEPCGTGSTAAVRRSFAVATGTPRPAERSRNPLSPGMEPGRSDVTGSMPALAEPGSTSFARNVTSSSPDEPAIKPTGLRHLTARSALSAMPESSADKGFQVVAPQPVLAPPTDAAWMQQALAVAALSNAEAATAAPDIRSSNTTEPVFTLTTETPIGAEGWGEEMGSHISWLSEHNISKAELTLHPAELGTIDITINHEDDRVSVSIVTRNEAARELLQDNMPRLAELLRQNGLALEQGSVSQHSAGQRDDQTGSAQGRASGKDSADHPASDTPRLRSALLHQGQIDHYV